MVQSVRFVIALLLCMQVFIVDAAAEETGGEASRVALGASGLQLTVPDTWKGADQRSRIIEHEFSAPADAKEGDKTARITMMQAGGSIDANIDRWFGQFVQPDGKSTKERAKQEEFKSAGATVHWVDIAGTFKESMGGGPFAPGRVVERENYRMLGAIIDFNRGLYFIKMTGPDHVLKDLSDGFKKSLKDLKSK